MTWAERARAALADHEGQFAADRLSTLIFSFEVPESAALFAADRASRPRTFTWLDALKAWEAENPGSSDSSMRRVCDALTEEGFLTRERVTRGWHVRVLYRVAREDPHAMPGLVAAEA